MCAGSGSSVSGGGKTGAGAGEEKQATVPLVPPAAGRRPPPGAAPPSPPPRFKAPSFPSWPASPQLLGNPQAAPRARMTLHASMHKRLDRVDRGMRQGLAGRATEPRLAAAPSSSSRHGCAVASATSPHRRIRVRNESAPSLLSLSNRNHTHTTYYYHARFHTQPNRTALFCRTHVTIDFGFRLFFVNLRPPASRPPSSPANRNPTHSSPTGVHARAHTRLRAYTQHNRPPIARA